MNNYLLHLILKYVNFRNEVILKYYLLKFLAFNCDHLKIFNWYNYNPIKEYSLKDINMSKHAILVTSYKNTEQINYFIELLDYDFVFYIHLDKKSNIPKEIIEKISSHENVKFIGKVHKVNWGGKKLIDSIFFLAKEALKDPDIKYFHICSEAHLPIKSKEFIKEFFLKNDGKQFLEVFSVPTDRWGDGGGLNRFIRYNFYDEFNFKNKIGFKVIIYLLKLQKFLGIKRDVSKKFPPLYGGSNWCSLSNSGMKYSLDYADNHPEFMKALRYTFAPEEIYFQTVLMQSAFRNDIINDNLVYIDWEFRNGNSPATLDMTDFENLKDSDKLFARKFDTPISEILKKELIEFLKSK